MTIWVSAGTDSATVSQGVIASGPPAIALATASSSASGGIEAQAARKISGAAPISIAASSASPFVSAAR